MAEGEARSDAAAPTKLVRLVLLARRLHRLECVRFVQHDALASFAQALVLELVAACDELASDVQEQVLDSCGRKWGSAHGAVST